MELCYGSDGRVDLSRSPGTGQQSSGYQLAKTKIEWLKALKGKREERSKEELGPITSKTGYEVVKRSVLQFITNNKLDELCTYGLSVQGREGITYKCVVDRRLDGRVLFTLTGYGDGVREWTEFDDEEQIMAAVKEVMGNLVLRVATFE